MLQNGGRDKVFKILKLEFGEYKNVFWENCTFLPLPLVLAQSDIHITVSSATTIEAGWFGVKTALLGNESEILKNWFSDEIANGLAEIVRAEGKCLIQWINTQTKIPKMQGQQDVSKVYFNDFINYIKQLCSNSK